jgi:hypothetical protein
LPISMSSGQFHNYLPSCQIYPQRPYVHCSLQLHGVWQPYYLMMIYFYEVQRTHWVLLTLHQYFHQYFLYFFHIKTFWISGTFLRFQLNRINYVDWQCVTVTC